MHKQINTPLIDSIRVAPPNYIIYLIPDDLISREEKVVVTIRCDSIEGKMIAVVLDKLLALRG